MHKVAAVRTRQGRFHAAFRCESRLPPRGARPTIVGELMTQDEARRIAIKSRNTARPSRRACPFPRIRVETRSPV
jgi:hypothetical protein